MGIGDKIMAIGRAEKLCKANDNRPVAIMTRRGRVETGLLTLNNPYLATTVKGNPIRLYDHPGRRPYIDYQRSSKQRWIWAPYRPSAATIVLSVRERHFAREHAGLLIVEPSLKPSASVNKQWPEKYWRELARMFDDYGVQGYRLTPTEKPHSHDEFGFRWKLTPTIRDAAAIMSRAVGYIGHEGALHHLAAAMNKPATVIMGGYITPNQTGYRMESHRYLHDGAGCGWRTHCEHCAKVMRAITPEEVFINANEVIPWKSQQKISAA